MNTSLQPALKDDFTTGGPGLASPIHRLQPSPHIAVDRLEPARPMFRRNVSEDDAARLRLDLHPPTYSPVSLTVTTADGPVFGEHSTSASSTSSFPRHGGQGMRHPETIWSAPAGTVEFPADVQQHHPHHHPVTPQQHVGGTYTDRRASIVGYTGFEPYPLGKLGMPANAATAPQSYQSHPGSGSTTYSPMQLGLDTKPRKDYPVYPNTTSNTAASSRARPPSGQQRLAKSESCPSDASVTSSAMPSLSDVEEAVNQVGPYEPRTDGFVYPINQVFPSPQQQQQQQR